MRRECVSDPARRGDKEVSLGLSTSGLRRRDTACDEDGSGDVAAALGGLDGQVEEIGCIGTRSADDVVDYVWLAANDLDLRLVTARRDNGYLDERRILGSEQELFPQTR